MPLRAIWASIAVSVGRPGVSPYALGVGRREYPVPAHRGADRDQRAGLGIAPAQVELVTRMRRHPRESGHLLVRDTAGQAPTAKIDQYRVPGAAATRAKRSGLGSWGWEVDESTGCHRGRAVRNRRPDQWSR